MSLPYQATSKTFSFFVPPRRNGQFGKSSVYWTNIINPIYCQCLRDFKPDRTGGIQVIHRLQTLCVHLLRICRRVNWSSSRTRKHQLFSLFLRFGKQDMIKLMKSCQRNWARNENTLGIFFIASKHSNPKKTRFS